MPVHLLTHLECGPELDSKCGLLIPNENKTILCLNDKVYAHTVDFKGYVHALVLFDNSDIFL